MRLYPWTPFVTGCRCLKPSSRSSRGVRSRKVKPWLPTRDTSTHWRVRPGDCGRWGCEMMWNMFFFVFWGFDVFCICGRMWMGVQFWTSSSIRTDLGWKLATQSRVDQQMHCCFAGPGGSIDVVHWLRQMFLQWWALPCLTQIIYNTYPWLWLYPSCN